MDFAVAGVCGQMKDPSGRASMAKGLDELLAGMVAVCALKPDVACLMYEPTFIMTSARLTGKDVIAATERALMYVGDLAIGPEPRRRGCDVPAQCEGLGKATTTTWRPRSAQSAWRRGLILYGSPCIRSYSCPGWCNGKAQSRGLRANIQGVRRPIR